ncbi:hypothetical protein AWJ20_4008 [Sugiyamaella lignohabitans]|uniref:Bul1 C-terminal domain-containing protein n=1 Tax=Sugiyamaella lignohabitans TaxID=796027 RepID=A0A167C4K3_9ASCO|nr:uncharacterized protein AWJ20_4008 [Sugiyamaella lignohabitans]ANB11206.1 hypothetical protein AWJ20_4008 [Sugiyamaella lignohabitans]
MTIRPLDQLTEDPPSYIEPTQPLLEITDQDDPISSATTDLPRYISGTTCEIAPCNTTSIYEPVVGVGIDPSPTRRDPLSLDLGDVITGKVVITPRKSMDFSILLVDLVGEEISLRDRGYSESHHKRVFTVARYEIPHQHISGPLEEGFVYTFTYSLVVPERLPREFCPCGTGNPIHSQLPPSYGLPLENYTPRNHEENEECARVLYRVRARLYKNLRNSREETLKIWAQGHKTVSIRSSLYPPLVLEELKDSNGNILRLPVYSTSKQLSHGLIRKVAIGTVELKTSEPLNIYLNNPSTKLVSLDVIYTPPSDQKSTSPLEIHHVSYKVNALTFASIEAMAEIPSRQSVMSNKKSPVYMSKDNILRQNLTICKPLWRLNENNDSKTKGNSYVTTLKLPFSFPVTNKKVVSTYFSCLTSRQYELTVTVNFGSSIGSHSITIPVLVTNYKSRESSVASVYSVEDISPLRSDASSYFSYSIPTYQESVGSSTASSTGAITPPTPGHNFTWGGGARRIARTCEQAAMIIASI